MSSKALGERLGMTAQGVRKLEQAEANGTITLNTLARLAHGLDCEVHYMFVPRTSLVEQVLNRTQDIAGIALPSTLKGAEVLTDAETLMALTECAGKSEQAWPLVSQRWFSYRYNPAMSLNFVAIISAKQAPGATSAKACPRGRRFSERGTLMKSLSEARDSS